MILIADSDNEIDYDYDTMGRDSGTAVFPMVCGVLRNCIGTAMGQFGDTTGTFFLVRTPIHYHNFCTENFERGLT